MIVWMIAVSGVAGWTLGWLGGFKCSGIRAILDEQKTYVCPVTLPYLVPTINTATATLNQWLLNHQSVFNPLIMYW